MTCHSEGVSVATEESLVSCSEILRFAQDDIFEINCNEKWVPLGTHFVRNFILYYFGVQLTVGG